MSEVIPKMIAALPKRGISLDNAHQVLDPVLFRISRLDALERGVALRDVHLKTGIDVYFLRDAVESVSRRLPKELVGFLLELPVGGWKGPFYEFRTRLLKFRTERVMGILSPDTVYAALVKPHLESLSALGYSVVADDSTVEFREEV